MPFHILHRSRAPLSPPVRSPPSGSEPHRQTPLSPSRRSPFAGREPGITSYQDHFLYSSLTQTTTQSPPTQPQQSQQQPSRHQEEDDYGLPPPEEYFSGKQINLTHIVN